MLSPILINLERLVVVILAAVAFLLAIVSFRGLVPVSDPRTPLGYVDQLSLLFGLHEQSHVVIVSPHQWSSDVHVFTFQKRLKDGAFYMNNEVKETVSVGVFDQISPENIKKKCQEILRVCENKLPFSVSRHKTPILFGLPGLANLAVEDRKLLISGLHLCLENSNFDYSKEASIGLITPALQNTMQWFAVTLLNGRLPYLQPAETPVMAETTEDDLLLTFAAGDVTRLNNSSIQSHKKVAIFGDNWDLVTVKIPNLGVLKARQLVLTNSEPSKEWAASPCVNPVVDRWWDFRGHRYHVKGLHKSVEEIKERNGPFAGKRVSRPVANYEACHAMVLNIIQKTMGNSFEYVVKELKKRKVYIGGKLFIKCAERGLTDPFKGGNVKLKTFMDSLKHACKVPNTDQPYACVDMMVVGVILDKVLGLHQSSILLTPHQVGGMTGDWPVTAALQTYQSGI
eukprot:GFUD01121965.1.p1 GENE.GFUD01121965.1~~GFUD01121965.1.p1  ORF type:complete len:455 (-),score=108.00 GFUD01121965.1:152-1516(-)